MDFQARIDYTGKLHKFFTPTRPIKEEAVFAGRINEIGRILSAIAQPGQHAIVYGERGVGKTSLANVLKYSRYSHAEPIEVLKIPASEKSTFFTLWNDVFRNRKLPDEIADEVFSEDPAQGNFFEKKREQSYMDSITEDAAPSDVIDVLRTFPACAIIIDEFDRVADTYTKSAFADLIKQLSDDDSLNITLILVGVADNISELIKEHASIERCTKQVHLKRMEDPELEELVQKGFGEVGMTIDASVSPAIAKLSQGFPNYTHQLCLNAGIAALAKSRNNVVIEDVRKAIEVSTQDAEASLLAAYHKAIDSGQTDNLYERVLIACALAEQDDLGYFAPVDIKKPFSLIMKREYKYQTFAPHLDKFTKAERGKILQRKQISSRRSRFRFKNPLMRPYVFLKGIDEGLIPSGYSPF